MMQINNARWEPVHGKFRFKHPWKEYTKIGALSRQCAYTMHVLHAHINKAESQVIVIIILIILQLFFMVN